jgi:predicted nucleic acid-binding protein
LPRGLLGRTITVITPTVSSSVLIDSSGWLEYLTGDSNAGLFEPYFERELRLLVPTIVLYEVRKILLFRQKKAEADLFLTEAFSRTILPLDERIALLAADLSLQHHLSMADAIVFATAQAHSAKLVTTDAHFSALPGVTLI